MALASRVGTSDHWPSNGPTQRLPGWRRWPGEGREGWEGSNGISTGPRSKIFQVDSHLQESAPLFESDLLNRPLRFQDFQAFISDDSGCWDKGKNFEGFWRYWLFLAHIFCFSQAGHLGPLQDLQAPAEPVQNCQVAWEREPDSLGSVTTVDGKNPAPLTMPEKVLILL